MCVHVCGCDACRQVIPPVLIDFMYYVVIDARTVIDTVAHTPCVAHCFAGNKSTLGDAGRIDVTHAVESALVRCEN